MVSAVIIGHLVQFDGSAAIFRWLLTVLKYFQSTVLKVYAFTENGANSKRRSHTEYRSRPS